MSWNETSGESGDKPAETPEVPEPTKEEVTSVTAEAVTEEAPVEPAVEETPEPDKTGEKLVSQQLIGKIAKSIREKSRSQVDDANRKLQVLEEENRRLKEQTSDPEIDDRAKDIRAAAREEAQRDFLERQDRFGKQKYGQDYNDALLLIQNQNDPLLLRKIMGAANPADEVIKEGIRIAEDLQYGSDPAERKSKKEAALKAKFRAEWEAEMSDKFKARGNQPTDVQRVRAAGGDDRPDFVGDTWETSLPK